LETPALLPLRLRLVAGIMFVLVVLIFLYRCGLPPV
jgi:hypothetical protein